MPGHTAAAATWVEPEVLPPSTLSHQILHEQSPRIQNSPEGKHLVGFRLKASFWGLGLHIKTPRPVHRIGFDRHRTPDISGLCGACRQGCK